MVGYRLSSIRNKGWVRLGAVGAAAMIPYTLMDYALGRFSEGAAGYAQMAEYLSGGIALWLVFGFSMGWVMHGFAVRVKDDDEGDSGRNRSGGMPGRGGTLHAAPPTAGKH